MGNVQHPRKRIVRFLLLTLPLTCLGDPAARTSPFRPPQTIRLPEGSRPGALACADFNRDGNPDLAVGSDGSDDVTIFLGDGRGGFRQAGPPVAAGPSPTEIVVGDFDKDGRLDLAIANHGVSRVTVLLGDGRGGFRPAPGSPLAVRSLPHPHTIDACDADGDGNLDLIIDSFQDKSLTLLRGDGRGGFRTPGTPIAVGRKPYRNLRARDFDGDGKCDIVLPSTAEGGVVLLSGDGHGAFRGSGNPVLPGGPSPFVVEYGDVNGDGKLDLVVTNYSGHISDPSGDALTFLLGDGKGGFRLGPKIVTGHGPFDVAAGDIDRDGYADAVTSNYGSKDLTVAFGGVDGLSSARVATVPLPDAPGRVILVDLNGDKKADAVTANPEAHSVTVLLAKP